MTKAHVPRHRVSTTRSAAFSPPRARSLPPNASARRCHLSCATCHARGLPSNNLRRWSAHGFSQYGADGIIHKLFADVGTTNKYYVEFGTQSGEECNTRRLRQTCGWTGLLMDGGFNNTRIGQHQHFLTRENIVPLFQRYSVPRSPDLLSVDIDGNDIQSS